MVLRLVSVRPAPSGKSGPVDAAICRGAGRSGASGRCSLGWLGGSCSNAAIENLGGSGFAFFMASMSLAGSEIRCPSVESPCSRLDRDTNSAFCVMVERMGLLSFAAVLDHGRRWHSSVVARATTLHVSSHPRLSVSPLARRGWLCAGHLPGRCPPPGVRCHPWTRMGRMLGVRCP